MGNTQTNIATIQQNYMNNITQLSEQTCLSTASDNTNNNVILVIGTNVEGNFTGVSTNVSTDSSCLMTSYMEDSISNILSAVVQQTNQAETDLFNGFQITNLTNTFNVEQSVTNNISQINQATCSANTYSSSSNNYVYVANSTIDGDFIGVESTSNASSSCSINNMMKNTTYNQAQAQANQGNAAKGIFAQLLGTVVVIVAIIVIAVIILFAIGAIGTAGTAAYAESKI